MQLNNVSAPFKFVFVRIRYVRKGKRMPISRLEPTYFLQPTSRCILFDGENISFDASLVIYINSTNIPPVMIINRIYENQNLLSL